MQTYKDVNIGKVYFLYLFGVLFLQIIGFSAKGSLVDTLWKAFVIGVMLIYILIKSGLCITRELAFPVVAYLVGQLFAWMSYPQNITQVSAITVLINIAIIIAMLVLFFSFPYFCQQNCLEDFTWFLNAFIVLMLYAVIYNFIKNPSAVLEVFYNDTVYSNMMSSFFDNKQTFGMFLLMALICSAFQLVITEKKIYAFLMVVFMCNLFICLSRTALVAELIFLIISAILMAKISSRYTKFICSICIIAVVAISAVPPLRTFIFDVVLDADATVDARQNIWTSIIQTLEGAQLFVGYGEGTASTVLRSVNGASYTHNGIIHVLVTGGAVKLILYVVSIIKCIICISTIGRYNQKLSALFFTSLISIIVYSMGESIVLFDTSSPCIAATIICAGFPCSLESYYLRLECKNISSDGRN